MNNSRVRTPAVREHVGARVRVAGWLHARRELGKIVFLVIRDGWGTVQIVAEGASGQALGAAGLESLVEVEGRVVSNERAPGGVELLEPRVWLLQPVAGPLPIPRGQGQRTARLGALLDHAPTVLRDPGHRAPLRIAALSAAAFREALLARGFTEIFTPRIVGAATEGGANVFGVDYFGGRAFLAQSPQLYKQIMVGVFERVFEVGPVFRAEPHATVRHLSEYTSLDVELGFIDSHHDVIEVVGHVLRAMVERLREASGEPGLREAALPRIPSPMPSLEFAKARERLARAEQGPREADDLAPAEERWLGEWAQREHRSDVLVITGYPQRKRPFYTHPCPQRPGSTRSFDVLFRGTELVTGGQRLHDHAALEAAMRQRGMDLGPFVGYLEAFAHGLPPHGGFAIGLERWVAGTCGLENIRRARAFVRDVQRTTP